MKPRLRASCVALGTWGLALVVAAEEAPQPVSAIEPSYAMFRALDSRVELDAAQRAFFETYFDLHARRLRDMKLRLNAGELSYVGALLEGHALRRDLDGHAVEWLDDSQYLAFGEIRAELRDEFRALFFREEHAWLLQIFGRSAAKSPRSEPLAVSENRSP